MSKEIEARVTNNMIDSGRSRKSRKAQLDEKKSDKILEMASKADDLFERIEKEKADADKTEEAERSPRLADFKDLVFLGRMEKEVEVAGWTFVLRTLTGTEQRELLAKIMSIKADQRLIYAKPFTIGMALSRINDTPLEVASASAGFEDPMKFICSWQDPLIERLYDEYENLFSSSKEVFTPETMEGDLKK